MKFWLVVCACLGGGVYYSFTAKQGHEMGASIIEEINPSCDTIRAWERARIRGDKPIGLPAPNEERLIECFPTYEDERWHIKDHFDYAQYLEDRMIYQNKLKNKHKT